MFRASAPFWPSHAGMPTYVPRPLPKFIDARRAAVFYCWPQLHLAARKLLSAKDSLRISEIWSAHRPFIKH